MMRARLATVAFVVGLLAIAAVALPASSDSARTIDSFEDARGWSAVPADGVKLALSSDDGSKGQALRLDFDFGQGGGYAVAHKAFALDLPENYVFTFKIRGESPSNHLEFKLIDVSGENVWWSVKRDAVFPNGWETWSIKRRQISFAWGPIGGGDISHVAAIEFAITAGSGGRGTVWIDELTVKPLAPPNATPPTPTAIAGVERDDHPASAAIDGVESTYWAAPPGEASSTFTLDLGESREYGGLIVDWVAGRHASDYVIEASDDGKEWRRLLSVHDSNGGRDYLAMPESESHYLRLRASGTPDGIAIAELRVQPLEWSATRDAFFLALSKDAPRGTYPRGITGEQSYWTVVGVDHDPREALFGADGALEVGRGAFSLEPFLYHDGELITWNDVSPTQSLEDGSLPLPSVDWRARDLELTTTAFATGDSGASSIVLRYSVKNLGRARAKGRLFVALRPFQVNPPSQFLNTRGGWAPIDRLSRDGERVLVNGDREVRCLTPPSAFGACTFAQGELVGDFLRVGKLPSHESVVDSSQCASGAFAFDFDVAPTGDEEVELLVPLQAGASPDLGADPIAWVKQRHDECAAEWRARRARIGIELPAEFAPIQRSLESQLAYILINRAGAAIQPGSRSYARSWIRDGSLTSSALLRMGQAEPVREFIEWFAPHQYANGKIPCCVDQRGADPVPENDSSGEFIFLVAEYLRYTGDRELAAREWPRVLDAAAFLDSLRQTHRTDEYRRPDKAHFFGLLPPSISHEGYSAKPMHSYWDDLFALRGFKDAVYLASELGHEDDRVRLARIRDEFQRELVASFAAAMAKHAVDYLPGCADLGDFDATSTTIALSPVQAEDVLPRAALERTFEKYYEFFTARAGGAEWDAYTPYEIRNIGAFVRLGWRDRAAELVDFFVHDQRPTGWRQWSEVVWRDASTPHFLGDIPHT